MAAAAFALDTDRSGSLAAAGAALNATAPSARQIDRVARRVITFATLLRAVRSRRRRVGRERRRPRRRRARPRARLAATADGRYGRRSLPAPTGIAACMHLRSRRHRIRAGLAAALAVVACATLLPHAARGTADDPGRLRDQIAGQKAHERVLAPAAA